MEQLDAQHHEQAANDHELEGGNNNNNNNYSSGKSNSYLCRQSSTRWSPTSEQIRILKELYYNNGVRSPSAEQIQRISAKLRQYGKIEGKNVFYWFQNHKARERQKKRFTTHADIPPTMSMRPPPPLLPNCKYHHYHHQDHHIISPPPPPISYNKFSNNIDIISPPGGNFPSSSSSSSSSSGLLTVGNYGYGSVAMEKSFRECSIGGGSMGHHHHHNFTWIGVDPYSSSPYPFLDDQKRKYTTSLGADQTLEMEEQEEEEEDEIETLPLFPMHGDIKQAQETTSTDYNNYFNSGWHRRADGAIATSTAASRASLELTLNSYNVARFPTTS